MVIIKKQKSKDKKNKKRFKQGLPPSNFKSFLFILFKPSFGITLEKAPKIAFIFLASIFVTSFNILITNNYIRTNTLEINVFNKSEINVTHQTVKTIKTVYNYEDRIEITTENINIQYRCLKVVDSIESGLELNY